MVIQITMCPACQSSFSLNASKLASFDGRVRYGARLAVFKAGDHLRKIEAHVQNSIIGSVFMSEEPLDYFCTIGFLNVRGLDVDSEETGSESEA